MTSTRRGRRKSVLLKATLWSAHAVILVPGIALSRTWRVPDEHKTIQAAVNAAAANDTVLVSPGTYLESVDAGDKWLTLLSVAGRDATVIDAQGAGRVVRFHGGGNISGFTLQNGLTGSWGGGIWLSASDAETRTGEIRLNRILDCRGWNGGGIYAGYIRSVHIEANEIRGNGADGSGGGIFCDPPGVIEGNLISGNSAMDSGGGVLAFNTAVRANVIVGNCATSRGGGIHTSGVNEVSRNTIVGNTCENGGNAIYFYSPSGAARISHNIIALNGFTCWWVAWSRAVDCGPLTSYIRIECNDFWGNKNGDLRCEGGVCDTTGLGNFALDPLFCDADAGNYSLQEGSPCAPTSSVGCGLVGALPVACGGTPVQPITWGRLKALYGEEGRE
jgi:hypothetical protein